MNEKLLVTLRDHWEDVECRERELNKDCFERCIDDANDDIRTMHYSECNPIVNSNLIVHRLEVAKHCLNNPELSQQREEYAKRIDSVYNAAVEMALTKKGGYSHQKPSAVLRVLWTLQNFEREGDRD